MTDAATHVLGELLVRKGFLTHEHLERALGEQQATHQKLGRTLLTLGYASGPQVVAALIEQGHLDAIRVQECLVDPRVLSTVPQEAAQRARLLPLLRLGDVLLVGVSDAAGLIDRVEAFSAEIHAGVEPVWVGPEVDVVRAIEEAYAQRTSRRHRDRRIGEALVSRKLLSPAELARALEVQRSTGQRLGHVIVCEGLLSARRFAEALAEHLGIPFTTLELLRPSISPEAARLVPRAFAEHNRILVFAREDGRIRVLSSGPLDDWLVDSLRASTGASRVEACVTTESDLTGAIREAYAPPALVEEVPAPASTVEAPARSAEPDDAPTLLNELLRSAIQRRASDVHIETYRSRIAVRFRIDGVLHAATDVPVTPENVRRISNRLKLDCELDIAEHRRPQDGSFSRRFAGRAEAIDFRVAIQPTVYGENAVIRILDAGRAFPRLEEIGFQEETLRRYQRMLDNPQGMILYTGPTGCGKTTSLYATLDVLRKRPIKIVTAEDPVEYELEGIQQSQVNEAIGNTFSRYLRGFLRQDPDVILVGETRDPDTAQTGVRAALTGHLVFTTLHTNDSIGAVRRLINLGIAADLVASSLLCVISQRLVRKVCPHCKGPMRPGEEVLREFYGDAPPPGIRFLAGVGCTLCNDTGYLGRMPIFEFWEVDDRSKDLIERNADDSELRNYAIRSGMVTMVEDALVKVERGLTTLGEVREEVPYLHILTHRRRQESRSSPDRA